MTHYGQSFKLLLELDGGLHGVLSNQYIANTIETILINNNKFKYVSYNIL